MSYKLDPLPRRRRPKIAVPVPPGVLIIMCKGIWRGTLLQGLHPHWLKGSLEDLALDGCMDPVGNVQFLVVLEVHNLLPIPFSDVCM